MGRRTILLIVAVVIAALGASMVFLYVQGVEADAHEGTEMVEVLAATGRIESGESIEQAQKAGKLDLVEVPRETVLPDTMVDTSSIAGKVALTTIFPGEQILRQRFGEVGSEEKVTIPKGTEAVSVQLTDPARVAGMVAPGNRVSIYWSKDSDDNIPSYTRLLLQDVQVVGVGDTTLLSSTQTDKDEGTETTEQIPTTILTLALTQDQAERVIYGAKFGELALGLLNDDSKPKKSQGVTEENLFEEQ
jgi:pilus assembly protein CpaB